MHDFKDVIIRAHRWIYVYGISKAIELTTHETTDSDNVEKTKAFYFDVLEYLTGINEFQTMSRAEIDLVPFTTVKWLCEGKKCNNGTKVRDYGIAPMYWSQRIKGHFFNKETNFWMCEKHYKMYKHLVKIYEPEHVYKKLLERKPEIVVSLIK